MRLLPGLFLAALQADGALAGATGLASYSDLCSIPEATLNGLAVKQGPAVRLLKDSHTSDQAGSLFSSNRIDMTAGGVMNFTFTLDGTADGFAVVAQSESRYALGEAESGLGFYKLENGLAIEFDFVENAAWDDPDYPHVELHTSPSAKEPDYLTPESLDCAGFGCMLLWQQALPDGLEDGQEHEVSVTFPPYEGSDSEYVLDLLIDQTAGTSAAKGWDSIILGPVNGSTLAALDMADMYVGVTAGTGTAQASNMLVTSWALQFPKGETTCMTGFSGDACVPTVPDNACEGNEVCDECTSETFCCAWTGSACEAATASSTDTIATDECAAVDADDDDGGGDSEDSPETTLVILTVILGLALVAVNLVGRQRVRAVLATGYGPLSEDVRRLSMGDNSVNM